MLSCFNESSRLNVAVCQSVCVSVSVYLVPQITWKLCDCDNFEYTTLMFYI